MLLSRLRRSAETWSSSCLSLSRFSLWPAGGKVQAEMYGQRLPNIRNLRIQGTYKEVPGTGKVSYAVKDGPVITANDGICLCVDGDAAPDYKVVAIYPYRFLVLEVEKL